MTPRFFESRRVLTLLLLAALAWSLSAVAWRGDLIHSGGLRAIGEIFGATVRPDISADTLALAFRASWTTVAYAAAGMTLPLALALPLGAIASGVLARSPVRQLAASIPTRAFLAFFRSVHELVWAWLFVAALGLSPVAAVLALGIPYGGILGRIYAELLQDVPQAPIRALRTAGASEWRIFWHARLPMALPDMLSYTFYRFECAIRSSAIMSFIGLGGLGREIQLSLDDIAFGRMWTFLYFLIGVVLIVDLWSTAVRRRLAP